MHQLSINFDWTLFPVCECQTSLLWMELSLIGMLLWHKKLGGLGTYLYQSRVR